VAVLVATLLAALVFQRPAQALVRHTLDDQELATVRSAVPAAAEAYEAAEARLSAGDWRGAEKLLATARALRPSSFLLARRQCQVLTELGQRRAAIEACLVALSGMTAMDERAYVAALMSGNELATPKDLADATREAANARRLPGQPFGDAALCEIAHHIGDDAMFSACLARLERNAPGYFETTRWRSVRPGAPAWLYCLGWSLLAALGAIAFARAFWRWFRSPAPPAHKARPAAMLVLGLSAALVKPVHADQPSALSAQPHWQLSHFRIDFDDPESQIPSVEERNANALEFGYFLQDLAAEAVNAERKGDYGSAVKFWRASAKAVPDEAVGFSHACRDYQKLDERDNALAYCAASLNLHGVSAADYVRFAELTVEKPTPLTNLDIQDLEAAIAHLHAQPDAAGPAAVIECDLGVKLQDEARLARCTAVLAKTTPNDPHTLTFEWSLAMKRKNYREARRLLDALAKTAISSEKLAELRVVTDKASAWWRRPFTDPSYALGLAFLLGVLVAVVFRKRAQLRGAPSNAAPSAGLNSGA
jgi:hypothetical protein